MSVLLMCFFIPMVVPWYFWGESLWVAYFIPALLRYTLVLNATWLVNSAAHMWGNRPYDEKINPRENKFVTFSAIGMKNTQLHEYLNPVWVYLDVLKELKVRDFICGRPDSVI